MLINKTTGDIYLQEGVLSSTLRRHEYLSSSLKNVSDRLVKNEQLINYKLQAHDLEGQKINATVFFDDETLTRINLAYSLYPSGATWSDWSIEIEMKAKILHESILENDLGSPQSRSYPGKKTTKDSFLDPKAWVNYEFPWGMVSSLYNEIAASSYICIEYSRNDPPRQENALKRIFLRKRSK